MYQYYTSKYISDVTFHHRRFAHVASTCHFKDKLQRDKYSFFTSYTPKIMIFNTILSATICIICRNPETGGWAFCGL